MDPIEEMEEKLRRREQDLEARELKARLKEIEQDLDEIPVTPTAKEATGGKKPRGLSQKASDVAKFVLMVFSVIVAIRIAHWVGMAIIITGVVWVAYKIFLEDK